MSVPIWTRAMMDLYAHRVKRLRLKLRIAEVKALYWQDEVREYIREAHLRKKMEPRTVDER